MRVFLDLDGVLVNFIKGAQDKHGLDDLYSKPENYGKDIFPIMTGMSNNKFWDAFDRVFWAGLEWMHDGKEILDYLEKYYGKQNICILSSPPRVLSGDAAAGKYDWVQKHIKEYERRTFIGSSKQFCAGPDSILIDDSDQKVYDFKLGGGKAVLIPRLWNSRHKEADQPLTVLRSSL